jgi:O-antigen ligase/tetratricopeptide (TPR) repeat protein
MKPHPAQPAPASLRQTVGRNAEVIFQAALLALIVATSLTPSDTAAAQGVFAVPAMLWSLLTAAAFAWLALQREKPVRWDRVDLLAALYLGWTLFSTFAVHGVGDMRAAINSFFQSFAFVAVFLLSRRLLTTAEQRRDALALLVSLAVTLGILGCLQYFVFYPAMQAELRANPDAVLLANGIPPDSASAEAFLNRALSKEPLGTFTLTNSLASFLLPWLLLLIAMAWLQLRKGWNAQPWLLLLGCLLPIVVCLLLTKSRTAVLVAGVGVVAIALTQIGLAARTAWIALGALAAVVALLGVGVWWAGGLDREVLSEAPTSVLYRLQYWESTLGMIGDYPLFGCGPGNFQATYPRYMLPEASELIADPHNFLLEIAATAGLPALVLFIAFLVSVVVRKRTTGEASSPSASAPSARNWRLGGALFGLLLATPLILLANSSYDLLAGMPAFVVIGIPIFLVGMYLLRPLLDDVEISWPILLIVTAAVLLNLLAAGGIGFPNVATSLGLLLAFCAGCLPESAVERPQPSQAAASYAALGLSFVALAACYLLCYSPVVYSRTYMAESDALLQSGEPLAAIDRLEAAITADPWSSEPCSTLAAFELQRYLATPNPVTFNRCEAALEQAIARNPRSFLNHESAGDAYLAAYRTASRQSHLDSAIEHYRQAVERYPHSGVVHARLAWAYHLAGNPLAADEAREALRLDELNPHRDKKLARYQLRDPGLSAREQALPLDALMRELANAAVR